MALGRSIRIYLDNGEVAGIRHAELVNWTGQALLCPRSRVPELPTRWSHVVARPGVYFLLGADQLAAREVYIGEAEDVFERLKTHVADRDFWQEVLIFSSKDENLTKAHVKYLESRLHEIATDAGRYAVLNGNCPPRPTLPRPDHDAMEEFLERVPLLLGVLGHRVLDGIATTSAASSDRLEFTYSVKEARARGVVTDEGFVVLKGSTALKGVTEAMSPGWTAFKEELVATKKLLEDGTVLRFAEDVLFGSPSAAAAIVYGNNVNGRVSWKTNDGRTLKETEEAATASEALH